MSPDSLTQVAGNQRVDLGEALQQRLTSVLILPTPLSSDTWKVDSPAVGVGLGGGMGPPRENVNGSLMWKMSLPLKSGPPDTTQSEC